MDALHEKIRKLKNVTVLNLCDPLLTPDVLLGDGLVSGFCTYARQLMDTFAGTVPAVRFSLDCFALLGNTDALKQLLQYAAKKGFFVILDGPTCFSVSTAEYAAKAIAVDREYPCDAVVMSAYMGSDILKAFVPSCKEGSFHLFAALRTANRSSSELQDLLTGTRHVRDAAGETAARMGEGIVGKCGFNRLAATASSTAPDFLKLIRQRHNRLFVLVDGLDQPSGNFKNASYAFDRFGHGAALDSGSLIAGAWKNPDYSEMNYLDAARAAQERMDHNIKSYISIL